MNQGEFNDMLRAAVASGAITLPTGDFKADGSVPMTGTLDLGTHRITAMSDATGATDGVSRGFGDARYAPISVVGDFKKDGSVAMTGDLVFASGGTRFIYVDTDNDGISLDAANGFIVSAAKLGFYDHAPAVQAAAIANAAGGATQDAEARTALNDLLAAMRATGLIAT